MQGLAMLTQLCRDILDIFYCCHICLVFKDGLNWLTGVYVCGEGQTTLVDSPVVQPQMLLAHWHWRFTEAKSFWLTQSHPVVSICLVHWMIQSRSVNGTTALLFPTLCAELSWVSLDSALMNCHAHIFGLHGDSRGLELLAFLGG